MKNKTKWFDPICYQFSFYLLGKKDEAWNPVEATKPFFEELIPYYNLWIALQGTVMVSGTTSTGEWIRIAKNSEMLHDFHNKLEQQSHALHSFEITLVPDKTQLKFAVSVKALSKSGDKKFCSIQTWMIPSLWVRLKRQRGYVKCSTVQQMILKGSVFHKNASSQREYR